MGRKESNQTNKQTMLSLDLSCLENSVNPDQLASEKPANPDAHCFPFKLCIPVRTGLKSTWIYRTVLKSPWK